MAEKTTSDERIAPREPRPGKPVRYAVVGLGHIAQVAVLPAFDHAHDAELVALVSDDDEKLRVLSERHGVPRTCNYEGYDALLRSGEVDAVYIALPNHLHAEFTVRAAEAGVHVLCEKPMAVSEAECRTMIEACDQAGVELMVAYRLHYERTNLEVAQRVNDGDIGDPRFFDASFSLPVKEGDIRVRREAGGGTLYDIGIYCINAARTIFRDEPIEVVAMADRRANDPTFREVEETCSGILRFPRGRLASFTVSFGTASVSSYRVAGTEGSVLVEPAFGYATGLGYVLQKGDEEEERNFARRDQFAPELDDFARCIREGRKPEPDGREGWMDIRIINALYESADRGRAIGIEPLPDMEYPTMAQEMERPPVEEKPDEVHTSGPRAE